MSDEERKLLRPYDPAAFPNKGIVDAIRNRTPAASRCVAVLSREAWIGTPPAIWGPGNEEYDARHAEAEDAAGREQLDIERGTQDGI